MTRSRILLWILGTFGLFLVIGLVHGIKRRSNPDESTLKSAALDAMTIKSEGEYVKVDYVCDRHLVARYDVSTGNLFVDGEFQQREGWVSRLGDHFEMVGAMLASAEITLATVRMSTTTRAVVRKVQGVVSLGLGLLSGYVVGYALGVNAPLSCASPNILRLVTSKDHWPEFSRRSWLRSATWGCASGPRGQCLLGDSQCLRQVIGALEHAAGPSVPKAEIRRYLGELRKAADLLPESWMRARNITETMTNADFRGLGQAQSVIDDLFDELTKPRSRPLEEAAQPRDRYSMPVLRAKPSLLEELCPPSSEHSDAIVSLLRFNRAATKRRLPPDPYASTSRILSAEPVLARLER